MEQLAHPLIYRRESTAQEHTGPRYPEEDQLAHNAARPEPGLISPVISNRKKRAHLYKWQNGESKTCSKRVGYGSKEEVRRQQCTQLVFQHPHRHATCSGSL